MQCRSCPGELVRYDTRNKWRCKSCLGVLVAADELGSELGELGAALGERLDTSRLAETSRSCPVCEAAMNQLKIDDVVIERCPRDRSMWFDAGELGKIRAAVGAEEASPLLVRAWDVWFRA